MFRRVFLSALASISALPFVGVRRDRSVADRFRTCAVCGAQATVMVKDLVEVAPHTDGEGAAWRKSSVSEPHTFCDRHARPSVERRLDGTIHHNRGFTRRLGPETEGPHGL